MIDHLRTRKITSEYFEDFNIKVEFLKEPQLYTNFNLFEEKYLLYSVWNKNKLSNYPPSRKFDKKKAT